METETLTCVRQLGPSNVAEVTERLNAERAGRGERPLAYRTFLTMLANLEAKGLLDHTKEGRAFRYAPTRTDEEYLAARAAQAARAFLARFGDAAVAGFAAEVMIDSRQRALLQELVDDPGEHYESPDT